MNQIIILGASTRAAAMSARRAGWMPWCADLFADLDLQRIAAVRRLPIKTYPHGLLAAFNDAPQAPVMYTGALENRPDLVARMRGPVWGNSPDVLRGIRAPSRWSHCLQSHGLPCPMMAQEPQAGRWLLKPRKSAGGLGIREYAGRPFNPRTHFLQEWIDGQACSALFLGRNDNAILLGVTQQLVGTPWLNATGFHYAGNIGPLPLVEVTSSSWRAIGAALVGTFHLRGLFGVDAIVKDSVPWPVEINPRYTASVEVLERAAKVSLLALHRDVFSGPAASSALTPGPSPKGRGEKCGKAILYARETFAFPDRGPWLTALEEGVDLDETEYADIPHAGEIIEQGRPVLTLFASDETTAGCLGKLQEKAQALDRRLWG